MTIKLKEQVEREMEITIPCYRTNGTFIVKVLGENETLQVETDGKGFSHRKGLFWAVGDYFRGGWSESTREDFEQSYEKFILMAKEQMNNHFDSVSDETKFPFLAEYKKYGNVKTPVVVCADKDERSYTVYFPEDNYDNLQFVDKTDITRLPSGSQIILTQS